MSLRQRGQEITIRFLVDSVPVGDSWTKVRDAEHTPRTDHKETDFLGEPFTDLDIQHHGHDISVTLENVGPELEDFLQELIDREENHEAPQDVQCQVLKAYREPGKRKRMITYYDGSAKVDSDAFRGRKEYTEVKVSLKYKKRRTVVL